MRSPRTALFPAGADLASAVLAALCGGALVAGYLTSATLGLIGLKRRGLLRQAWVLLLMPLHWLLLSVAAWRALWQLVRDPLSLGEDRAWARAHLAPRRAGGVARTITAQR